MTKEETSDLERLISLRSLSFSAAKERCGMVFYVGAMIAIALVFLWLVIASVVSAVFGVDFGWNHPHGLTIFVLLISLSLAYAAKTVLIDSLPNSERRDMLRKDIDNGVVEVEKHTFTAVKVFQEQEHGGLIYFLRAAGELVYVYYDRESQDLGVAGEDPMASSFEPKCWLTIERTPIAKIVLSQHFVGAALEVPEVLDLTARPDTWPESGTFIRLQWAALESTYGG